jgi:hypothetical protein
VRSRETERFILCEGDVTVTDSDRIAALEKEVAELRVKVSQIRRGMAVALGWQAGSSQRVAKLEELDGPDGDPKITKDPPRWTGAPALGFTYSETSAEYLLAMAAFQDWSAEKARGDPEKKKYAKGSELRASLARGWAARIKAGWVRPEKPKPRNPYEEEQGGRDDIPF